MGRRAKTWGSFLAALGFLVLWIGVGSSIVDRAKRKDFLNLYVGGTLAAEGRFPQLHNQATQFAAQRRFDPDARELWPFVRPPFYAALLSWLPLFSFDAAFRLWLGLQIAVLLACWAWAARELGPSSVVWGGLFVPTALGVIHGQDCPLMLAVAVASYHLLEKGKPGWAGAVLALSLYKFHLLLLFPLAVWVAGERRMLRAYLAAAAGLTALSVALTGPAGIVSYLHLLTDGDLRGLHPSPERTLSVFGLAENLPGPHALTAAVGATATLALALLAVRDAPRWRWFAAGLTASLLAVPHVYAYDAGVLLLSVWLTLAYAETPAAKLAAALAATPLPYLFSFGDGLQPAIPCLSLLALLSALAWESVRAKPAVAPLARAAGAGM
ncbi:MAG: DUF2029 domain-containing protein [Acidobacteria bacterium]|nr:DUF2029 domain-containing protein [Acidobacteriota bacterium]